MLRVLDAVFAGREADPALEAAKRRAGRRIYAAHYLDFANKYFWFGRNDQARRCYLEALRRRPSHVWSPGVVRRLAATMTSRRLYEGIKSILKARPAA